MHVSYDRIVIDMNITHEYYVYITQKNLIFKICFNYFNVSLTQKLVTHEYNTKQIK